MTYFAGFAVYDGHVLAIFGQPLAHVDAELADQLDARRVVVVERKPLDAAVKPRRVVRTLRAPDSIAQYNQSINQSQAFVSK